MTKEHDFIPALGYNSLTSLYDKMIDWTMPEKEFRNKLIEHLSPQQHEQIMEFGFGTGQNIIYALRAGFKASYYGIDVDPKVEVIAKKKLLEMGFLNDVKLELYDGKSFPYPNGFFDKIFSCLVFHQLKKEVKKTAMKEIYRVLKPGGKLLICDWGKPNNLIAGLGFYLVQLLDGFESTTDNRKGFLPIYLENTGFKNIQQVDIMNTNIGTLRYNKAIK